MRLTTRILLFSFILSWSGDPNSSSADEKLKGIACRSVHLGYPAATAVAFFKEVTIEKSAPGTYFMVCGWSKGYFGIQELGNGKKLILFSVWDPGNQNDPKSVNEDNRVKLLHQDREVRVGRFGGEANYGGQSFFDFEWKSYQDLSMPGDSEVAEIAMEVGLFPRSRRERMEASCVVFHSHGRRTDEGMLFVCGRLQTRQDIHDKDPPARFGNGWIETGDGSWQELTKARFTADANPVTNIDGGIDRDRFFLSTGGEIENKTVKLGQSMILPANDQRKPPGQLPHLPRRS